METEEQKLKMVTFGPKVTKYQLILSMGPKSKRSMKAILNSKESVDALLEKAGKEFVYIDWDKNKIFVNQYALYNLDWWLNKYKQEKSERSKQNKKERQKKNNIKHNALRKERRIMEKFLS